MITEDDARTLFMATTAQAVKELHARDTTENARHAAWEFLRSTLDRRQQLQLLSYIEQRQLPRRVNT